MTIPSVLVHQVNTFGPNLTTAPEPCNAIWYSSVKEHFKTHKQIDLKTPNMPRSGLPNGCCKKDWVQYINETYGHEFEYWLGHSVGGVLGLHMAQKCKIAHLVLIAPHYLQDNKYQRTSADPVVEDFIPTITHFLQNTKYFEEELDFKKIKENTKKITVFVQKKDPLIPYSQVALLIENLRKHEIELEVIEDAANDHFVRPSFEQLVKTIKP